MNTLFRFTTATFLLAIGLVPITGNAFFTHPFIAFNLSPQNDGEEAKEWIWAKLPVLHVYELTPEEKKALEVELEIEKKVEEKLVEVGEIEFDTDSSESTLFQSGTSESFFSDLEME